MPEYDYIYLGDNARTPYGTRSFEVVYEFTLQAVNKLFALGCPLVILACNTASAKALRTIQQMNLPQSNDPTRRVLGVIRPTAECIGTITYTRHIGILATAGTIKSQSYPLEVHKLFPDIKVTGLACPMWVPLVENNEFRSPGADYFVKQYIDRLLEADPKIDTIVLGCTHYPLLIDKIKQFTPSHIQIIAQGEYVAHSLRDYLDRHTEMDARCTKSNSCRFLTTESPGKFEESASIFLRQENIKVEVLLWNNLLLPLSVIASLPIYEKIMYANKVKKIAAVHDLSGAGRVSLTVVIPILSSMGFQVCPLPTAVLSSHTQFPHFSFLDLTDEMPKIIAEWKKLEVQFDAIYTGYLGSPRQIQIVSGFINDFRRPDSLVVIDPVLGDNGKLYTNFDKEMIIEMRHLITQADVITPNLTELFYLLDKPYKAENSDEELKAYLHELSDKGPETVIITSIPVQGDPRKTSVYAYNRSSNRYWKVTCPYLLPTIRVQEIHLQASLPVL